jgi:EAL domain-containing protein (putative c-di-GMP-specific phosphodiesterase class I)
MDLKKLLRRATESAKDANSMRARLALLDTVMQNVDDFETVVCAMANYVSTETELSKIDPDFVRRFDRAAVREFIDIAHETQTHIDGHMRELMRYATAH